DAVGIQRADRALHVIDVERTAQERLAHATSGAIGHLGFLQVEYRVREVVHATGVVPVHMRQDHVTHLGGVDSGVAQRLGWCAQDFAASPFCGDRIETGVHDDG